MLTMLELQKKVLELLASAKGKWVRATDLRVALERTTGAMTPVLFRLLGLGYVERQPGPTGRRGNPGYVYRLTPMGVARLQEN